MDGGAVVPVYGVVLLFLIVPEFAAIAVIVLTIAVLVGLVALAAAALAARTCSCAAFAAVVPDEGDDGAVRRAGSGVDRSPDRPRAWAEHT